MESNGEVGQVNISDATYQIIKNTFTFSFIDRGTIEVKNKGMMQMYYVANT